MAGYHKKDLNEQEINDSVKNNLYHYFLINGFLNSRKLLIDEYAHNELNKKEYRRQLNYLTRQIVWNYIKNIFLFPIWLIKILTPSFLKGSPNIWTNIKLIATKQEFRPLRMAMMSWLVFTYVLVQGGIFYFQKDIGVVEAATFTWVQTGWTASSTSNASHTTDRTGWTNYWDIYPTNITTTTGSELTLATEASSTLHTTTAHFNRGTTSTASVTGNGVILSTGSTIATADIKNGSGSVCALKEDGTVFCWGSNADGQLGQGTAGGTSSAPVQVLGVGGSGVLSNITKIAGHGGEGYCALNTSNNVYCWGDNGSGELGNDNNPTDSSTPVQVLGVGGSGFLSNITGISGHIDGFCAMDSSNNLYCWGQGVQSGADTFSAVPVPTQVVGVGAVGFFANVSSGSTGDSTTCAIDTSNDLYCWGENSSGSVGDQTTTNRSVPVQVLGVNGVGNLTNVIDVTGGAGGVMCAVNTSGSVYCWGGNNFRGERGDGTDGTVTTTPVQVVGVGGSGNLSNIVNISAGQEFVCALDSGDDVYCWGWNSLYQGGNGSIDPQSTPVAVSGVGGSGTLNLGVAYVSSGTFTSNIIDTVSSTVFGTMTWTTSTLANTTLTMKVRTGQKADMSDATAWASCNVVNNTGDDISSNNCVTDGERYIQYQTALATSDTSVTPELQDVTINYTRYTNTEQTLTSSPFDTSDVANILSSIAWTENLPTGTDIKFQIRTAPDSSGSPGTWTSWLGPTNGSDYYTNSAGGETINSSHTDGTDDQWIQYKVYISSSDGGQTPTLSDVTVTYVVNEAPQFSGSGVSASQISNGSVRIIYSVLDSDATTDTDGLVTPSFEYSLNNGSSWSNITGHITESGSSATSTRALQETTWSTSTVLWDARQVIDGQDVSQAMIRVTINDGEAANNLVTSTSAAFALDVTDPALGTPSFKVVATKTPATITNYATDNNSIQMISGLSSDVSDGTWESYAVTDTITLATDPDTVYVQFRDAFSNTTTIQSATTPETPTNMVIKDISNASSGNYKEFIIWETVAAPSPGFSRYDIYRSTDGSTYTFLSSEASRTTNYYLDQTVSQNTTYYYKVATVDSDGNTSAFSSVVSDNADGQGGTDTTAPTITNRAESNITTQGFTITWDTDEVASSSVAYSANAFGGSFSTTTVDTMVKADGGSLGGHSVSVIGLSPNTTYYYQLASSDPNGNISYESNSGAGYSITTLDGPSISSVAVDSVDNNQATIVWTTNVSADSQVYYSTNSSLSSPSNVEDTTATTNHSITLTGLIQGTTYYFYVESGVANDKNSGNYYSFITTNDTTVPTISSVSASPVADTTAVITWTTNEGATTQLLYGTTSGSLDTYSTLTTGLNLSHTVSLTGLTEDTTYYYTVSSVDGSGNATTSSQSSFVTSEELSTATEVAAEVAAAEAVAEAAGVASVPSGGGGFPYTPPSDKIAPTITNIRVSDIATKSVKIEWDTNEAGDSILQYGKLAEDLNVALVDISSTKTNHSLVIGDLSPSTQYTFKVSTADISGNRTISTNQSFTTLSGLEEIDELEKLEEEILEEEGTPESIFKSLIDKTAEIIRRMSGEVSIETLESGLATQYTTIKELGALVPLPLIGGRPVVEVGSSYARVYWTTDKPANSLVAFAPESTYVNNGEYSQVVGDATEQVENHDILISELRPNTTYHYQVRSKTPVSDTARSGDLTFTTKDEQAEIITYKVDLVSDSEAVFNWTTNIPTDSVVTYIPYGQDGILQIDSVKSVSDKAVSILHGVTVSDMEAGITYQVELSGKDLNGNILSKIISTFSTSETDSSPIIVQVQTDAALLPGDESAVQAIVSWTTNEPSTSQVFYQKGFGRTDDKVEFSRKTPLQPNYTKRHILVITDFEPGTVYQFQVESIDSSGNVTRSRTYTLLTPRQKESVFQVIMSNLEDTFGWVGQLGL